MGDSIAIQAVHIEIHSSVVAAVQADITEWKYAGVQAVNDAAVQTKETRMLESTPMQEV